MYVDALLSVGDLVIYSASWAVANVALVLRWVVPASITLYFVITLSLYALGWNRKLGNLTSLE